MRTRQFLATFSVGALFGSAVLLTFSGHDLDLLYLRLTERQNELNQLQEDHQKLQEKLTHIEKSNVRKIHKINVTVLQAPDEFIKLAVQKEVKNRMKKLVDKELKLFEENPDVFHDFLDSRQFHISDHLITIKMKYVVVGETTTIFIEAFKDAESLSHSAQGT
ncbi:hypothetical protein CIG75_16320 [Tumebacillus algifaecis]|uniref:Sporulation membrane protein YtrI C-terminal domain-containing protein n=1 Tax=Tumebacillus algifaecis TaxID=1214604 RepID=A0A223D446_9BACL|nr:hypothetical protein [Tumebacillus algifaecis]ASS76361.1 hypothetical protein CIG75_16320 [Tumebacillus algifaecis]